MLTFMWGVYCPDSPAQHTARSPGHTLSPIIRRQQMGRRHCFRGLAISSNSCCHFHGKEHREGKGRTQCIGFGAPDWAGRLPIWWWSETMARMRITKSLHLYYPQSARLGVVKMAPCVSYHLAPDLIRNLVCCTWQYSGWCTAVAEKK